VIPRTYFVFDVESVGLHGEGFAVGWVVITAGGEVRNEGVSWCEPALARQDSIESRQWVANNVPPLDGTARLADPAAIRRTFWVEWTQASLLLGAVLAADVAWPVEARFLLDCIADDPRRAVDGPYPLVDIASVRLAHGLDPLETADRRENELPPHNPLADARQSARLLVEALNNYGL
jgi:hypothetical protein